MKQPLVTIVTPSYQQGHFIRATIESVLSQDYPRIEYIIMDGGSTDSTANVAGEYASRLEFISEKDRGQSHAINKGFRRAKGEIVFWLNSDDVILPGAVSRAVEAFEADPRLGCVYGEGYLIDQDGNVKCRFPATEPFNLWKLVYLSDYVLQQTAYFRKAIFDEIGYLDESLHYGMDWELLMRIGKHYPMQCLPHFMGSLREYGEAKTFSGGGRRFRELAVILRRHGSLRYPPGYWTYGLETYSRIVNGFIERLTPGFLEWPSQKAQNLVLHLAHRRINVVLRDSQGLYADGWAGPVLHYMLPRGRGRLRIAGVLPDVGAALHGQTLRVLQDGVELESRPLQTGAFETLLDPLPGSDQNAVTLRLEAGRWFTPKGDPRRLAWQFSAIDWAG